MISRGSTQKVLNSANLELLCLCFVLQLHSWWPCCLMYHLDYHRASGSSLPSSSSSLSLSSSSSHNCHERHHCWSLLLCSANVYSLFRLMFSHYHLFSCCSDCFALSIYSAWTFLFFGPFWVSRSRTALLMHLDNVFKSLHQICCLQRGFFVSWSCPMLGIAVRSPSSAPHSFHVSSFFQA